MTRAVEHLLGHFRVGCPGETTEKLLSHHVDDCPTLKRHPLFQCPFCMDVKITKRPMDRAYKPSASASMPTTDTIPPTVHMSQPAEATSLEQMPEPIPPKPPDPRDIPLEELRPGQWFQMDMGFVRGSGFDSKDEDGRRITSLDGYNSYQIIVDRKTRRTWTFLSKNKVPPMDTIRSFLQKNGCRYSTRKIIRSDQGGELW